MRFEASKKIFQAGEYKGVNESRGKQSNKEYHSSAKDSHERVIDGWVLKGRKIGNCGTFQQTKINHTWTTPRVKRSNPVVGYTRGFTYKTKSDGDTCASITWVRDEFQKQNYSSFGTSNFSGTTQREKLPEAKTFREDSFSRKMYGTGDDFDKSLAKFTTMWNTTTNKASTWLSTSSTWKETSTKDSDGKEIEYKSTIFTTSEHTDTYLKNNKTETSSQTFYVISSETYMPEYTFTFLTFKEAKGIFNTTTESNFPQDRQFGTYYAEPGSILYDNVSYYDNWNGRGALELYTKAIIVHDPITPTAVKVGSDEAITTSKFGGKSSQFTGTSVATVAKGVNKIGGKCVITAEMTTNENWYNHTLHYDTAADISKNWYPEAPETYKSVCEPELPNAEYVEIDDAMKRRYELQKSIYDLTYEPDTAYLDSYESNPKVVDIFAGATRTIFTQTTDVVTVMTTCFRQHETTYTQLSFLDETEYSIRRDLLTFSTVRKKETITSGGLYGVYKYDTKEVKSSRVMRELIKETDTFAYGKEKKQVTVNDVELYIDDKLETFTYLNNFANPADFSVKESLSVTSIAYYPGNSHWNGQDGSNVNLETTAKTEVGGTFINLTEEKYDDDWMDYHGGWWLGARSTIYHVIKLPRNMMQSSRDGTRIVGHGTNNSTYFIFDSAELYFAGKASKGVFYGRHPDDNYGAMNWAYLYETETSPKIFMTYEGYNGGISTSYRGDQTLNSTTVRNYSAGNDSFSNLKEYTAASVVSDTDKETTMMETVRFTRDSFSSEQVSRTYLGISYIDNENFINVIKTSENITYFYTWEKAEDGRFDLQTKQTQDSDCLNYNYAHGGEFNRISAMGGMNYDGTPLDILVNCNSVSHLQTAVYSEHGESVKWQDLKIHGSTMFNGEDITYIRRKPDFSETKYIGNKNFKQYINFYYSGVNTFPFKQSAVRTQSYSQKYTHSQIKQPQANTENNFKFKDGMRFGAYVYYGGEFEGIGYYLQEIGFYD